MAQIADIIKYEGDNGTFVWKHPCEDFNSLTQLIVHESQEAVFFIHRYREELLDACLTEGYIVPNGTNSAGETKYRITPAGRAKRDG